MTIQEISQSAERRAQRAEQRARRKEQTFVVEDPAQRAVHQALSKWLSRPVSADAHAALKTALTDFELRSRLRRALPLGGSAITNQ